MQAKRGQLPDEPQLSLNRQSQLQALLVLRTAALASKNWSDQNMETREGEKKLADTAVSYGATLQGGYRTSRLRCATN